jgi:Protein of unknown function (DUF1153)
MQTIRQSSEAGFSEGAEGKPRPIAQDISKVGLQALSCRSVRWVPQRKAEILDAVRRGSISLSQACTIYELSIEEFLTWQRGDALYGLAGLRATMAPQRRRIDYPDRRAKDAPSCVPSPAENE